MLDRIRLVSRSSSTAGRITSLLLVVALVSPIALWAGAILANRSASSISNPHPATTTTAGTTAGSRRLLYRQAVMTPLQERELSHWQLGADNDRAFRGHSPTSPSAASELRQELREHGRYRATSNHTCRTMCVRLCDGYYFPISSSAPQRQLATDARLCESRCSSPARLFVQRSPADSAEDMKDLQGQPYDQLKTAFLYRTEYLPDCKCQPHPWETEATERHRTYAMATTAGREQNSRQATVRKPAVELRVLQETISQSGARNEGEQTRQLRHHPTASHEASGRGVDDHGSERADWLGRIFQGKN